MNFARAARGTSNRDGVLRKIDSQSEMELGRHMDSQEKTALFSRFSPEAVENRIYKV